MVKKVAAILMAVLPATASAQDAKTIISAAMKAMGGENNAWILIVDNAKANTKN